MIDLVTLRADAEALARQLPDASLNAAAADLVHPGGAERKRAGSGEQFWQFRHYAQTDGADRIDWRRSARGDDYFVRESELETARTILFWSDPNPGFDWRSDTALPSKADLAKTIMLAIGIMLAKSGERVGVVSSGRPASLGKSASNRLAEDLINTKTEALMPLRSQALCVIASDFYDGVDAWRKRLAALAAKSTHGVLLNITDPVEHEFPFSGRTRFSKPGGSLSRLFGKAETVRDAYLERQAEHQEALKTLASKMDWGLVSVRTDTAPIRAAAALQLGLTVFGARI